MNILFAYNFNRSWSHKTWISCHLLMASLLGRVHMEKGYENCWKTRAEEVKTNSRGSSERQLNNFPRSWGHPYLPSLPLLLLPYQSVRASKMSRFGLASPL